jgi:hypothetical protein
MNASTSILTVQSLDFLGKVLSLVLLDKALLKHIFLMFVAFWVLRIGFGGIV